MARLRKNFARGMLTVDLLADSEKLISDGLTFLPVISGTDYMTAVIDPSAKFGMPEVVYITSHAAGAKEAVIARGKEGSTPRQHRGGVAWVNAPLASDFATSEQVQADDTSTLFWMEI